MPGPELQRKCCLSCAVPTILWNGRRRLKAVAAAAFTSPCAAEASATAFANGHWYGSDPGCYLTEEEISTPLPEIK